jgi:hypothetical protein
MVRITCILTLKDTNDIGKIRCKVGTVTGGADKCIFSFINDNLFFNRTHNKSTCTRKMRINESSNVYEIGL